MEIEKEFVGLKKVTVTFNQEDIKRALLTEVSKTPSLQDLPCTPKFDFWDAEETGKLVCELVWTIRADMEEER
jgi:hypothetical protein